MLGLRAWMDKVGEGIGGPGSKAKQSRQEGEEVRGGNWAELAKVRRGSSQERFTCSFLSFYKQ